MLRISNFLRVRIDGGLTLLVTVFFLLILLFGYMETINRGIENYTNYTKSMKKLYMYNQEMDNVFMHSYRYLDNDKIIKTMKEFERTLQTLDEFRFEQKFSSHVIDSFNTLKLSYQNKAELIENFKTFNARIISSIDYLYELERGFDSTDDKNLQIKELLEDILFKLGEVFIGVDLKTLNIEKDLINLNAYRNDDQNIDYFYRHIQQFLFDVRSLKNILSENEKVHLKMKIDNMNELLEKEYYFNQQKQELLGILFFILAFLILIMLIHTYLKALKDKKDISYLAYHDVLTGLPNRTEFERVLTQRLQEKDRRNDRFTILFIDLDRFKIINDTLGHDIGDELLIILSRRIRKILRKKDLLARFGGDEFVVILEGTSSKNKVQLISKKLIESIKVPIYIKEYSLNTTASIGIARYPDDATDKSTLLKYADTAMYCAKENNRDTYAFYNDQLSIDIQRRLDLEQELVHALKQNEFTLHYQPQYDLKTQKITGAEALVRWNNINLGSVSPEEFIAVAEDTGSIIEIGYFIFRTACREFMRWKAAGLDINLIAINISSVQFRQPNAFENFKRIIEETGISAEHIEIELTERYIMEYSTENLTILDDLRELGCRISIDDFGTGYSSMSYLKRLSIDTIKIDKSFIMDLPDDIHDAEVAQAIIVLSQSLRYEVIAEGIETLEQESLLREYKCDMGQGYYFGKPMDADTFVQFVKEKSVEDKKGF